MFGIAPIIPLLLDACGPDLCRVSDPQFEIAVHQPLLATFPSLHVSAQAICCTLG
jgi:hypothetical protein